MDETTIEAILKDHSIDKVSGVPFSAIVFMLYYGLELKHFLLEISDEFISRFPLEQDDAGESASMYLSGSAAQGLYLNTQYLPDARDIDIVTINKKYPVRLNCKYEQAPLDELPFGLSVKDDENQKICQQGPKMNVTTTECDDRYLNIKVLPDTPKGYVLVQKCRSHPLPVQTVDDLYVSSLKTTEARVQFWHELEPFFRQRFEELDKDSSLFSFIEPHGPAATAFMSLFESTTPFEIDIVFCIPYPMNIWYSEAVEWINRERPSGWPLKALVDEIVQDGCTLIPKGSVGSPMEDFEWRVSFTGDLKLARSLTRVQREIMHILKALVSEPQHGYDVIDLTTSIESFQFLNLMYYESEHINQKHWCPENIARMLLYLIDKYLEHFHRKELNHYFIRSRNIFEKFRALTDEEMDTILYTVLRLRQDPLGQILQQEKYLRLPSHLHKMVYLPFVEEVKSSSYVPDKVYVNTLVRLAKAHLLEENYSISNIYALDAIKFYHRMANDTLTESEYMDLMFIVALSYHRSGSWEQSLEYLEKLYLVINKLEKELLYRLFGLRTYAQLIMLYARILTRSLDQVTDAKSYKDTIPVVKHLYHQAEETESNIPTLTLDMMNLYLHLGDTNEFENLIDVFRNSFSEFESVTLEFENGDVSDEVLSSDVEVIYDRSIMVKNMQSDSDADSDPSESVSKKPRLETSVDSSLEDSLDDETPLGQTGFEQTTPFDFTPFSQTQFDSCFEATSFEQDLGNFPCETPIDRSILEQQNDNEPHNKLGREALDSTEESLIDAENFDTVGDELSTEKVSLAPDTDDVLGETKYAEDDDITYTQSDLNMIDIGLFTDYCRLKEFQKLDIKEKVKTISERLERNIQSSRASGKVVSFKMLDAAYDMFFPKSQTPDPLVYFHDILAKENENDYIIYSTADIPLLDEDLVKYFKDKDVKSVKIPAKIFYQHLKIRYYKLTNNKLGVKKIISIMETLSDDMDNGSDASFSKYLMGCHLEWVGDSEAARDMYAESAAYLKPLVVKEQVLTWYKTVFDIVRQFEPKNKYLDDIFAV